MSDDPHLSRHNTRKHWALYALDKHETEHGRQDGADARDIYQVVGGDDSIIFKSIRDTFDGLIGCDEQNLVEWRTEETDFSALEWESYRFRMTPKGAKTLLNAGKPTKKPMRMEEGYSRDLPVPPNHDIQVPVMDTPEKDTSSDEADEPESEPAEPTRPEAAEYDGDVTTEGVDEALEDAEEVLSGPGDDADSAEQEASDTEEPAGPAPARVDVTPDQPVDASPSDDKDVKLEERTEAERQEQDSDDWLLDEGPGDWLEMDLPRADVYWRDEGDRHMANNSVSMQAMAKEKSIQEAAAELAEAYHDGWDIVVTVGPYRMQDVMYRVHADAKRIHLDFYSVRPGTEHIEAIIQDITRDLRRQRDDNHSTA